MVTSIGDSTSIQQQPIHFNISQSDSGTAGSGRSDKTPSTRSPPTERLSIARPRLRGWEFEQNIPKSERLSPLGCRNRVDKVIDGYTRSPSFPPKPHASSDLWHPTSRWQPSTLPLLPSFTKQKAPRFSYGFTDRTSISTHSDPSSKRNEAFIFLSQ